MLLFEVGRLLARSVSVPFLALLGTMRERVLHIQSFMLQKKGDKGSTITCAVLVFSHAV
jgi:hypothetical protein